MSHRYGGERVAARQHGRSAPVGRWSTPLFDLNDQPMSGSRCHPDQRLDGTSVIHGLVGIGDVIEVGLVVEDPTRIDRSGEHVDKEIRDVDPGRSGPATPPDVVEKGVGEGNLPVGNADDADRRPGPGNSAGGGDRLGGADALEGGVGTDPGGEFEHSLGGRVAPLLDQVGGTELQGELLSLRVPAEGDDPLGAESQGRQDRREADCPVAMTSDRVRRVLSMSSE